MCSDKSLIQKDTHTPMFIAAPDTITKIRKQCKCTLTAEWMKKTCTYIKWNITRWGGRGGMAERAALSTRVTVCSTDSRGTCSLTREPTQEPGGNWEGVWGGAGLFKDQGTRVHLRLTHADAWHKPRRRCKIIILQLKIKWKKFNTMRMKSENEKCFSGWKLHLIK